jgi:hypothetical protein
MKSMMKWLLGLYVILAIITMGFQISYRYPNCADTMGCGVGMAKGVVWSTIWPIYRAIQKGLLGQDG